MGKIHQQHHQKIASLFANLFPDQASSTMVASFSGMNILVIPIGNTPLQNWFNILTSANNQNKAADLLKVVLDMYPNNQELIDILKELENNTVDTTSTVLVKSTKKQILFFSANPIDTSYIQVDIEHRLIKVEMSRGSHRDNFEFLPTQVATNITELIRAMADAPNIVHFSGHGSNNGIYVMDDQHKAQLIPVNALTRLFSPIKDNLELVLLNSCHSSTQAKEISMQGCYVIGHNLAVGDAGAVAFAKGFYIGLSEGKSYQNAFNDGMIAAITNNSQMGDIVEVWKDGEILNW